LSFKHLNDNRSSTLLEITIIIKQFFKESKQMKYTALPSYRAAVSINGAGTAVQVGQSLVLNLI